MYCRLMCSFCGRHALFPLATVAALVSRQARTTAASTTDEWIAGADPQGLCPLPLVGRAFCTLPLPLWSGLVCPFPELVLALLDVRSRP